MRILVTICARGGSKGIPGKNIRSLNGRPLITYSIQIAKKFQSTFEGTDIILSTDSKEILDIAKENGLASEYQRPHALASDSAGKLDAIEDVLLWKENRDNLKFDYVLDLDVTSPLRNLSDLTEAFNLIQSNPQAINLFSVSPSNRNPYFNMVEKKENGFFAQVVKPPSAILTRQSTPEVFDLNASFYFYKRIFFDIGYRSAITDKSIIYVVPHICFDLDHPIDFDFISYLIANNKLDFAL